MGKFDKKMKWNKRVRFVGRTRSKKTKKVRQQARKDTEIADDDFY